MNKFQKRYGVRDNENTEDFHKSKRMFCIYNGKLRIAPLNAPYSHAEWFLKEGWMII